MKAKLHNDGNKIFHRKKRKQPRRSLKFDECLNRIFTSESDLVKLNIKTIYDLRNNATHLVIPFIPVGIMGLFQAGVLNYPKALQDWFSISLSSRVPLGMMVLVYDFDPEQYSLEYAKMKRRLSVETIRWLTEFQQDIRNQAASLGDNTQQFYIPVDFQLVITKNPKKADIALSSGISREEALILEVPKSPDKMYPYRMKGVIQLVNQNLGGTPPFNQYDVRCIKRVYNVESRAEFCYQPKFSSLQYNEKFVDWIVKQATKKPDFFVHSRLKAKKIWSS
ncbi:MAG: DUF3644 domain-containing protein [Dehalococcoidales bacterium]|nr:DUF3644 domain-containing protein [Dehalococcoidales bacterium]